MNSMNEGAGKGERAVICIGIDCGVNTGFAVWNSLSRIFIEIETLPIHKAMALVSFYAQTREIKVRVEDARQVRFKTDPVKLKGAGSVCRDAKIWEDFLTDKGIPFEMVRPNKRITNWTAEQFKVRTGYQGRTSTHARDAAMLVYGI